MSEQGTAVSAAEAWLQPLPADASHHGTDLRLRSNNSIARWKGCKEELKQQHFLIKDEDSPLAPPREDPAVAWTNLKFVSGEDEFDDFALRFHAFMSIYPSFLDPFDTDRIEQLLIKFPAPAVRAYRKRKNNPGPYSNTNLFEMMREMQTIIQELNKGAPPKQAKGAAAKKSAAAGSVRPASHASTATR